MQELFISILQEKVTTASRICVFGGGTTGQAVISFLRKHKKDFFLIDSVTKSSEYIYFHDTVAFSSLPSFSLMIKSPGVSPSHPLLLATKAMNIPILSEIALARSFFKGKILGITGTDGKSTTTALTHHILSTSFPKTKPGGNFGIPFIEFCEEDLDFAVLELSSYQLEDSLPLKLDSSAFLNLAPDHLERHKTMEAYREAKLRIVDIQNPLHTFVINERLQKEISTSPFLCKTQAFGISKNAAARIISHSSLIQTKQFAYEIQHFPLLGFHNLENLASSILLCESVLCPPEKIQSAISDFHGLKYRFENIHTYKGATFINDSKSTNLHSLISGIQGYSTEDRLVFILGGRPKEESIEPLVQRLQFLKPIRIYVYGEAAAVWKESFSSLEFKAVKNPREALESLYEDWKQVLPNHILFSPGCASFDLYKNFEERGKIYTDFVKEIYC
jgi:UDP-N-acetylmuramoylalanine--D-glutamate ligase